MEVFVSSLGLLALSGITWIAYWHPDGFPRLGIPIAVVSMIALFCALSYDAGAQAVMWTMSDYVKPDSLALAYKHVGEIRPNVLAWILGTQGLNLYILLLYFLPTITGRRNGRQEEK